MDLAALTETIPGAIALFFACVAAVGTGAAGASKAWRWAKDKNVQAVPASVPSPQQANPFGDVPQTDPALLELAAASHQASRAIMRQTRESLDELRKAFDQTSQDQARMAQQLAIKERLLERLQLELECERSKRATAMAAVQERDLKISALEAERADLEARLPTPMRPPRF